MTTLSRILLHQTCRFFGSSAYLCDFVATYLNFKEYKHFKHPWALAPTHSLPEEHHHPSLNVASDPRHSAWEIVLVTFQSDLSIPAGAIAAKDGNNKQFSIFGIWNRSSQLAMIMTVVVCFCFLWPCVVCGHHTPFVPQSPMASENLSPIPFSPRQIDSHPSASSSDRSWAPQRVSKDDEGIEVHQPSRLMFRLKTTISKKKQT